MLNIRTFALSLVLLGCTDPLANQEATTSSTGAAATFEVLVNANEQHQTITGFGASSAWNASAISDGTADIFFSPEEGLGLSLLRVRIAPDGTTTEMNTARRAHERGVKIWAAPWSPPGEWKTNGSDSDGGSLLAEHYQGWADRLASFAKQMNDEGVPLFALSAQNEPNWTAVWETCRWTPAELTTFIGQYLGPALEAQSPDTKLIAPETIDWQTIATYGDAILADEDARGAVDIVATHSYGGTAYAYTAPAENGKEFWETEISRDDFGGMADGLIVATMIHDHLTIANVNAWHYWWLIADGDGSLMQAGTMKRQGYTLGNFSKFVRPGYVRIGATDNPAPGVYVSAFRAPQQDTVVIVAINDTDEPMEHSFAFEGTSLASVTPWVTAESLDLEEQPELTVSDSLTYILLPSSVTSFVGVVADGAGGQGGANSGHEAGAGGEAGAAPETGGAATNGGSAGWSGSSGATGGSIDSAGTSGEVVQRGEFAACLCQTPGRKVVERPWAVAVLLLLAFSARAGSASPPRRSGAAWPK